jgi:isoleucyl-tRNA synthetase
MSNEKEEKLSFPEMEEEVLNFWDKANVFQKSVERDAPNGNYVFYDGPPFGTGEPHYGHILSSVSKDVMPRFWTMKGYRVERRWGWDCHGLPIENIIETDLKISGKKDIEEKIGVANFNESCRTRVLEYADIWEKMVRRIGRWVDFKNSYKTMDKDFMESVWWAFSQLWKKELVYEGKKVLLYCTRCETPISNFEVAMDNSYKDVTDTSIYIKFKIKNAKEKLGIDENVFILAWTTTPWTLPGNVALAVEDKIDYVLLKNEERKEFLIIAKDRVEDVLEKEDYKELKHYKGKDLVGLEYEPLYKIKMIENSGKRGYYVLSADFVTTQDGTGIVHIAPTYGEDDYKIGTEYDLPIVPALDYKGYFKDSVPFLEGIYFKKANNLIIEDLKSRSLLLKEKVIVHSYPHCHRCGTPLIYNAIPAWFVNINKIRGAMIDCNEKINWYPSHLKHGRFGKGLETAPDWNISRNRYFGTPIPVWECDKCNEKEIIGNIEELKKKSGINEINDIHSHFINNITWKCQKCGGTMHRIPEVFDCWVESGSMPFAQMHYPFENKEKFESNFPAQFISEYISQTRAWFYVMHVLATALFNKNSFENVVTTGVILNEKGEKMSKSKKNFPDPNKIINEFGADALRFYLMNSSVMHSDNLSFNENEVKDIFRKNIMILWNVFKFYELFAVDDEIKFEISNSKNILDQWIICRLNQLIKEVTSSMENYDLPRSMRPITEFINDLSTWYIRRSRDRFKSENEEDKKNALGVTRYVLIELSKIMAPFTPFIAETIWQKVTGSNFSDFNNSVHLEKWPVIDLVNSKEEEIINKMKEIRKIVEMGMAKRDEVGIKVRQPLSELKIINYELDEDYIELLKEELNIKKINSEKGEGEISIILDTVISEELKFEGIKREIVRSINNLRKEAGLSLSEKTIIFFETKSNLVTDAFDKFNKEILSDTISEKIEASVEFAELKKELKIEGEMVTFGIKKEKL